MSVEAIGFVWRSAPYRAGVTLVVHLAVADVVNDANGNEFWMPMDGLAQKARCGITQCRAAMTQLVDDGFLEQLDAGGGRGNYSRYRFLMPSTTHRIPRGLSVGKPSGKPSGIRAETHRNPRPIGITQENAIQRDAADSCDVDNPGDPSCRRCQGRGVMYVASAGVNAACVCTTDDYVPEPDPVRPPVGFGLTPRKGS